MDAIISLPFTGYKETLYLNIVNIKNTKLPEVTFKKIQDIIDCCLKINPDERFTLDKMIISTIFQLFEFKPSQPKQNRFSPISRISRRKK